MFIQTAVQDIENPDDRVGTKYKDQWEWSRMLKSFFFLICVL